MGLRESLTKCRRSQISNALHSGSFNPDPPPEYEDAISSSEKVTTSDGFAVTHQLQIQAIGYDVDQAITGRTLENISVYRIDSNEPQYTSIRVAKNSNSCALVRSSDPRQAPLISTIYRFGPGRHPRMRILPEDINISVEEAIDNVDVRGELIEVKSASMFSRAQVFDTSFGKLEWRYGTSEEQAACDADSLLVLSRIDRVPLPDGSKSKSGTRVAQFVRNDRFRTPGSVKYSGGNGGRLMMDLRLWDNEPNTKTENAEAFIVSSCILMLKREADRFIDNHLATVV